MRYYHTPVRMAKIKKTNHTKYCQGHGSTEALIHCRWGYKVVQPFWKTVWQFLIKLSIYLLYDPVIALLDIYPRKMKVYAQYKDLYMNIHKSLFVIAKNWKFLIVGEKINKTAVYIEMLLSGKNSELLIHTTWMNLKIITLTIRNQAKKGYLLYDIIYIKF